MPVYLPDNMKGVLPENTKINTSLLMTKYANVKTSSEKEQSLEFVERVCLGKQISSGFSYTEISKYYAVMRLCGRMMVDQSGGIMENANLCLHSHFGLPYIPGSAVKGCVRHYVWTLWDEAEEPDDKKNFAQDIVEIFGYPTGDEGLDKWCTKHISGYVLDPKTGKPLAFAGKVVFFAAMPIDNAKLESDVLTSHHPDYYSGKQDSATDDESPIPVFFPAVKSGSYFEFVVKPTLRGSKELTEKTLEYLKSAMEIIGVGAKTAAGYGWFEYDGKRTEGVKKSSDYLQDKKVREKEERKKQELAEERISRKKEEAACLESLSPDQQDEYHVKKWADGKWSAVLGKKTAFDKLDDNIKSAVVRVLASDRKEHWLKLKQVADTGKKKDRKAALPVRDEINAIAKRQTPQIKMPKCL